MAAPSTGQPVIITMGAIWRFQVDPPAPTPPQLPGLVMIIWVVSSLARVVFGVVYFDDCPRQPNIPNFLLGLALASLLMIPLGIDPWQRRGPQPHGAPSCLKACLLILLALFIYAWILAGNVWIFSIYQPNYDPKAPDGLYCNKTLYTFAFWNAVWETFSLLFYLGRLCKGLMCCVFMSPALANRDAFRNV